ncbi:UNVERIFIED_CONTAM: hypothetical protein H355_001420 [Colinus virginianus]|nr:hypothetical protein H355_001420 [Colinus virginianus]
MENSQNAPLIQATLETLLRFLNWIPLGYMYETKLISTLTYKVLVLKCSHVLEGLFKVPRRNCRRQCKPVQRAACDPFSLDHDAVKTGNVLANVCLFVFPLLLLAV